MCLEEESRRVGRGWMCFCHNKEEKTLDVFMSLFLYPLREKKRVKKYTERERERECKVRRWRKIETNK